LLASLLPTFQLLKRSLQLPSSLLSTLPLLLKTMVFNLLALLVLLPLVLLLLLLLLPLTATLQATHMLHPAAFLWLTQQLP
jgi:hypothetical protein